MNHFEVIQSYLNNELPDAERQAFDAELAKNADLRRAVVEQRLLVGLVKREKQPEMSAADAAEYQRLRKVVLAAYDNTDEEEYDVKPSNPFLFFLKKNKRAIAAAASVALVATVSIWLYQRTPKPQPETSVVQTPTIVPPIDTLIKSNVPTPENQIVVEEKGTPQYKPEKKPETQPVVPKITPEPTYVPTTNSEKQVSDDAVLAILENVANKEFEQISGPTKGASSSSVSKENQTLLDALEAISANKPQVALDLLKNREDNDARYYRALATLLTDKTKGKQALQALADDAKLERFFRNKIKDLLIKL
jgi:outer membrane biosynthesis protein TonB